MTLPTSGPISIGMVAAELGISLPISLGDSRVRALAGVPTGPISLGQLRGKSSNPYTPMALTTTNGTGGPASSDNSGGTVSGQATVSITGGVAPYSIQWTVTDNPGGCTFGSLTNVAVTASHTFTKLSNGSATVLFSVTVTDSTGRSVSRAGVEIDLYWGTAN